ncbi:hypothetical protein SLA2020_175470 [Shorea laevis]
MADASRIGGEQNSFHQLTPDLSEGRGVAEKDETARCRAYDFYGWSSTEQFSPAHPVFCRRDKAELRRTRRQGAGHATSTGGRPPFCIAKTLYKP